MPLGLEDARRLDRDDPLAGYRSRFAAVSDGSIYLDGNSLGRLPLAAIERSQEVVSEWGERLVRGWGEGWYELPRRLGAKIARLIGAEEDEVIVCDSTSVNLYKLATAAIRQTGRTRVVTDEVNFPSDIYVLHGASAQVSMAGPGIVPFPPPTSTPAEFVIAEAWKGAVDEATLARLINKKTALLSLSHVSFRSALIYDMAAITELAHEKGALMLWDLCHSVGAMPIHLNECNVDLAVGCTYKYLNGGPGSPAFLYVRRDLQEKLSSPIQGWFGQKSPFEFGLDYEPALGINRFLAGTPPIVSMATMEPGIDMLLEAGMDAVRAKGEKLTMLMVELYDQELAGLGFELRTPKDPATRGSHVALAHKEGWRINQSLIEDVGVIPDFRQPDNIRLGLVPLYTTFEEVWEAVQRIKRVVEDRLYEKHSAERAAVT